MKRFFLLSIVAALLLTMSACGLESRQDQVLNSLGRLDSKEFYTSGGFQDYTDHGKYTYSDAAPESSPYFNPITPADREILWTFLDNFENWIDTIGYSDPTNEVVVQYAFDRSIVDDKDYFYIYEGENYPKFGCYDIWIFDTQANTLYYFHSNI